MKFKKGDIVELVKTDRGNKLHVKFTFIDYLPEKVGTLDCVVRCENGDNTFGCSTNLSLAPKKAPLRKEISFTEAVNITKNGKFLIPNFIKDNMVYAIHTDKKEQKYYLGKAKCQKGDKFNIVFGVALATARAIGDTATEKALLEKGI